MFTVQSKTTLPIPKILAWNDDPKNPTGTEYIIQEHASGVQLHGHWPSLNILEHLYCTQALSYKIKEMASLDFPAYGNIYFADAPIEDAKKIPFQGNFVIGPYCSPLYWNCGAGDPDIYQTVNSNRGPCKEFSFPQLFFFNGGSMSD